jgi:RNA polymerase sigma-70 factor (ECF subfamily)
MDRRAITATNAIDIETVYRRDGARMQRALLLYSGSDVIAEDAVAEAFAQALRRGGAIRDPAAWVWRSAFKIAAGRLRDRSRETRRTRALDRYEIPAEAFELMEALRKLPPKQRGALILHHMFGYTARESAVILGSTPPAVMVHLSQGRKRLRRLLEVDDV